MRLAKSVIRNLPFRHSRHLLAAHASTSTSTSTSPLNASTPHTSVLLDEILELFKPIDINTYVDCTLGAGGHAFHIASAHPEVHTILGIDIDPSAHEIARQRLEPLIEQRRLDPDVTHRLLHLKPFTGNYSEIKMALNESRTEGGVDAILMDLGVSSMQLDQAERGFSFLRDGPIDMRMGPSVKLSAEEVVNTWSEAQLGRIIREYGEEKAWRLVARRIVEARERQTITTTSQLSNVIGRTQMAAGAGKKGAGRGIHPATRTFQALRIAVNDELGMLERALPDAIDSLRPGGRLAVISFHSLEDRIVKHAFLRASGRPTPDQEHLTYGELKYKLQDELERNAVANLVTRKPLVAGEEEVAVNARSRSAKLRVLEKRLKSGDLAATKMKSSSKRKIRAVTSPPATTLDSEAIISKETPSRPPQLKIRVGLTEDGLRGHGAFALEEIKKGEWICDYEGEVLDEGQYSRRYPDGQSVFATELTLGHNIDASSLVGNRDVFSAVHMNHSRKGRANVTRVKDVDKMRVMFFATCDIAAGEELTYDYGREYWKGREDEEIF